MGKYRHKLIADALFLLHFGWLLMLASGTVYIFFNRDYVVTHVIILSGTLALNLPFRGRCPLTLWEGKYRKLWDPNAEYYFDSFVATHMKSILKINMTSKQANWMLTIIKLASYGAITLILTEVV